MTPAQLHTIEEIFLAALEQEPDQVSAFLDRACEGDDMLRRTVEALLASDQRAGRFIERSTVGLATKIIENKQARLLVGQTIGHYKISEPIGTGGMGEVYLATDTVAGRRAALKLLPFRFTGDVERLKRFQQEAHAVVGLNHPNILTVYEIGADHSTHYIASELIEGETLRERLTRGPMQLSEAVDIAIQVASALAAAHQAGIVHRDIKPENIMLRPDGYVKVLDFGIAKLAESTFAKATADGAESMTLAATNLGSILGTVRYMSPEQACGAQVNSSTDIWSLGVVLYEMVTGHAPFTGDTPGDVMSAILKKEPPPVARNVRQTPAELQQIIGRTLRKDRDQRYGSAHELLQALKGLRHKLEVEADLQRSTAAPLWLRWLRAPAALVLALLLAALALALPFYWHRNRTTTLPLEKSVAVLPLQNLSEEKQNAFFAEGVHDELLSNLAKIKELKVISRTSVMQYESGTRRNLKEIAQQLGVSNVVEGSVRRAGNQVRVSVQLIDARTDTHLWAEHYDRDFADIFAIQSEIAQQIVNQLHARLSASEKAAIADRPTADFTAYALYAEANSVWPWDNWGGAAKSMARKVELLEKATQRDPTFALAYCALAKAFCDLSEQSGLDRTHLDLAKKAADAAVQLRPDLGESHRELARYYHHAKDYGRAYEELTVARRKLPNDSEVLRIAAETDRHLNRWNDALPNLRRANELDPRNREVAYHLATLYREMRLYNEQEQLLVADAVNERRPHPWIHMGLAQVKLDQGDPVAAQSLLAQVPLDFSPTEEIWATRFCAALYLRDYDAANRVIAATPAKFAIVHGGQPPESWADGLVARGRGDKQKAQAAFAAAREKLDAVGADKPKDRRYFGEVASLDAGLGRKEEAIREARQAVDLMPIAKDSAYGPELVTNLALVYAWTGERDLALEQLEKVATIPAGPSYGDLKFNPCWDDLRGDPSFDKIVAAAKAASR